MVLRSQVSGLTVLYLNGGGRVSHFPNMRMFVSTIKDGVYKNVWTGFQ